MEEVSQFPLPLLANNSEVQDRDVWSSLWRAWKGFTGMKVKLAEPGRKGVFICMENKGAGL